jgi:hypothetical protein
MTTPSTRQRELIETEEELGLPLLGYTVVPALKGIEIKYQDALAILTPLGFHDALPGLPKAETSLKRAIKRWMKELGNAELGAQDDDDILLRPITRHGSEIIALALVVESSDLAQWGLSYLTNLRVFYNKKTDTLSLTRTGSGQSLITDDQDLLDKLDPHFQYYKDVYTVTELGRMVGDLIGQVSASTMREKGGTYFIPSQKKTNTGQMVSTVPELQRLKDLIELQLPAGPNMENTSSLSTFPVIDTKKSRRQMSDLAHKSFVAELTALKKDLARFEAQLQKKTILKSGKIHYGKIKPETIIARMQAYKDMKTKIELYQATLDMRQDELLAELDTLTQTANRLRETATDIMAEQAEQEGNIKQTATPGPEIEEKTSEEELAEA